MITALTLPALVGVAALAIDTSLWSKAKNDLQGAADSAALGAVVAAGAGATTAQATTEAKAIAAADGFVDGQNGLSVTVNNPPQTGSYTTNNGAYEVLISQPQTLFFGRLWMSAAPTINVRAVAGKAGTPACLIALDTAAKDALTMSGGTTTVTGTNCTVAVNSANAEAANLSGGASIDAKNFFVDGSYATSGGSKVTGTVKTGVTTTDPYSTLAVPTFTSCNAAYSISGGSASINQGCYAGISVSGGANLTLNAGTYIISGGSLNVSSSTLSGSGVSIVLTKNASNSYGSVTISGGSTVTITPTTSGALQGVAIYMDRNAPTSTINNISGGSNFSIEGSLYFPSQKVNYSGGSGSGSGCLQLIARLLVFSGGSTFGIACGSLNVPGLATARTGVPLE